MPQDQNSDFLRQSHRLRGLAIILVLYVLANALIWIFADHKTRLSAAADGDSWYRPALALMTHGAFVELENAQAIDTYRPPLYPLFEAAAMKVAGGPSPAAIAVAQIVVLILIGLLFRDTIRDWFPGWENVGLALLLFNPSVLSSAQFVQSEILFLAFCTLTFWGAAKYARVGGWRNALVTGLGVALACLTRPTAQFLLLVLPLLFVLLARIETGRWRGKALLQGAGSLVLAVVVITPWVAFVAAQGHGLALSGSAGKYRYVWDQVTLLEAQANNLSYHEASARLTAPGGAEHDFVAKKGSAWKHLSKPEQHQALAEEGMRVLLSYPAADFAKTLFRSQAQFFLAGGAGNWHNLFGVGADAASGAWFASAQTELWPLLKNLFSGVPPTGMVFSAAALGFAIAARLIGLIGLYSLFRAGRWDSLLIISGFVLYFAFIHVFVGNSRYRIAVEPMLTFLVIAGLVHLVRIVRPR